MTLLNTQQTQLTAANAPRVSVLVPIYNVADTLEQCLDSLLAQTMPNLEVICIDDGSTDACPQILEEYRQRDVRVRVIRKPNSGYGSSMNRGLEAVRAPYVGICEPDDWVEPQMFECLLDACERHGGAVDVVKASYTREVTDINASQPRTYREPAYYLGRIDAPSQPFTLQQVPDFLYYHPSIWTCIYRTDFLRQQGIRFRPIPGAGWADNPFFLETLVKAASIVYVDQALYHYREVEDGTFSHLKDWRIIHDRWMEMDQLLRQLGVTDPGIWEGHYNRGCSYIEMIDHDFDTSDPFVAAAIDDMVRCIDYEAVRASDKILQSYKNAYQSHAPAIVRATSRMRATLREVGGAVGELATQVQRAGSAKGQGGDGSAGDSPKVSVLVPIYNVASTLPQCLESLLGQTLRDIEIICIDDGSTDASPRILQRYAAADPRIRIITKPNSGYGASMNRGIQAARAPYIGICEPDDWADTRMFETYWRTATRWQCDLVKSNYHEHYPDGSHALQRIFDGHAYNQLFDPHDDVSVVRVRPAIWSALYSKRMLDDNGIRFSETPGASFQDTSFVQKCWISSRRVMLLKPGFLHYRAENPGSSSVSGGKVYAVCGEYQSTFEFLRQRGQGELVRFGPTLNAMRNDAYSWNYCRIAPEYRREFAQRWSDEMCQAQDEGLLTLGMFNNRDRQQVLQLMSDPQQFYVEHSDGVEYL